MKVSNIAIALACLGGMAAAHAQQTQAEGDWMMRVRAVKIDTANKSEAIPGVLPSNAIHVTDKTIPEVDFSYFLTKNIAAELILTYPQKHDVKVAALGGKVGSFKHLPPTLTLQYHFLPEGTFRPYVGAGVNYTRLSSVDLNTLDGITQTLGGGNTGRNHLDKNSWGGALQLGMDVKVGNNLFLNFDVKKVHIKTDLKNSALGDLSTVKVNPLLIGVGLGFKF